MGAVVVCTSTPEEIADEQFEALAQRLAGGAILVIATRRKAADGTPLWLRVWQPGRWIYLAAFDAPSAEEAAAAAQSGPAEMTKRAPDRWTSAALRSAAETALGRFAQFERLDPPHRAAASPPPPQSTAPQRTAAAPERVTPEDRSAARRASIALYDASTATPPLAAQAGLVESLFVLALLRNNPLEQLDAIAPIREHTLWLTPHPDADDALVAKLWQVGWLRIDANSPIDAFDWEAETAVAHYLDRVVWRLVLPADAPTPQALMRSIERRIAHRPWRDAWYAELPGLWAWIARMECVAYLELSLADHALPFHAGEKTHRMIATLLEHFAIGQVHNLIWRAARDAGARIRREPIAPQHAANTAIGAIERMGDRARQENWTLKPYRRDRRLEESTLSHLVFRLVLGADDPFADIPDWSAFRKATTPEARDDPPDVTTSIETA